MIIDCARYVAGVRVVEPMSLGDAGRLARQTEGFVWVALSDPGADELDELAAAFGVRRSALDKTPEGDQRPKLEHHGESTILTVTTVRAEASTTPLEIGAVDIFVGGRYAIAIGQSSPDALEGACERLRTRPEVAEHGPLAAAWAVLDAVIDGSEHVVDGLGDELERIQVAVFQDDQDQSEPIYLQLRDSGTARPGDASDVDDLRQTRAWRARRGTSGAVALLGDVSDQARRLSEEVVMLGEALEGLLNANLARVTVRQNVIIQQVSAWAAIAAVATIITGIYGMNFRHMPELDWVFGYPLAIAIMALTVVVLRWYFKRVGWL